MNYVKERLSWMQQRCKQTLKAFGHSDYRLALKALSGFEVNVSLVRTVLRDYFRQQQKQKRRHKQERRKK
jgi:hypothetical protein